MSTGCDFEALVDFIDKRMRMSQIYQPLLIRALVDAGGAATLRQLAQAFLAQDESQLLFYERRIRQMPLRVLRKHGVVQAEGQLVSLACGSLTYRQRAEIRRLCEQKMQDFIARRGLEIWDYRLLEGDPVPESLRIRVLKDSGGRCALCGATARTTSLEVDHIVPRSRGGSNSHENLQVLCRDCNQAKSNTDTADYRTLHAADRQAGCPFCDEGVAARAQHVHGTCLALPDKYAVTPGHMLIIPRRHVTDWFGLTDQERRDADELIRQLRAHITAADSSVAGFNIGANCGEEAGQTIFHAHIHLIPRRKGDCPAPRGGVRGVIPGRMGY
ncbi:HNH endonuclease family protein [Desulfovibrio sp. A2]|nr:HNH endonuclease family protein [Desulfovibrio sp. A2]